MNRRLTIYKIILLFWICAPYAVTKITSLNIKSEFVIFWLILYALFLVVVFTCEGFVVRENLNVAKKTNINQEKNFTQQLIQKVKFWNELFTPISGNTNTDIVMKQYKQVLYFLMFSCIAWILTAIFYLLNSN